MSVPYPRKHESWNSWDNRCKEWERDRARWNREQHARSINWGGYNYHPVQNNVSYITPSGQVLEAVKVNCSWSRGRNVERFAVKNGLAFARFTWGTGITSRTDNVAFMPTTAMLERYNNDNH